MSLRIRDNGRVLCAAMHKWQPGDQYLDDSISERLTGATGMAPMLVTEPMDIPDGAGRGGHRVHGEWWWVDSVPDDVKATVDWAGHPPSTVDVVNPHYGVNTHYGVVVFSGDPVSEHPDEQLRGLGPSMEIIACGPETFCWENLARWTAKHPLRLWETAEVLARNPDMAKAIT